MPDSRPLTVAPETVPAAGQETGQEAGIEAGREADAALLRRIAAGEQTAMAAFYQRHGPAVFAHLLLVTDDRAVAEEVLQDTMLAIWRGAASYRGEAAARSWAIAIARRQARDRGRRRRLRLVDEAALAVVPDPEPGPEASVLARAEAGAVGAAIRTLPPAHREVLSLAFGAGLALPEVADVLELPLGTVKSRLAAARTALGRILTERGHRP